MTTLRTEVRRSGASEAASSSGLWRLLREEEPSLTREEEALVVLRREEVGISVEGPRCSDRARPWVSPCEEETGER